MAALLREPEGGEARSEVRGRSEWRGLAATLAHPYNAPAPELSGLGRSAVKVTFAIVAMCGLWAAVSAENAAPKTAPAEAPAAPTAPAQDAPASLVSNGDFERAGAAGDWPDGWPRVDGASWEREDGNRFLRLRSETPGRTVLAYVPVALAAEHKALELSFRVRATDIRPGKQAWFDGRIMMNFKDAAGTVLKPGPSHPSFRGTSRGWLARSQRFLVPAGATVLELMPAIFQAQGGTLDLDDVRVAAVPPESVPPPKVPPPKPVAPPSETMKPARPESLPPALHVDGNQLKTPDGRAVWLQGVAVASMEWTAGGEHILESVAEAIDGWKANCVRLSVKDDFWFGRTRWQNDGGAAYRRLADAAVEAAASRGAYLVLDLHRFGAPMDEHVAFWKDAATRYRNHPAVLMELFNEAHSLTWPVWRDGGEIEPEKSGDVNAAENAERIARPRTSGMQALVDAVRGTGAMNLVIAGGLDWGYDLSGVAAGYALAERPGGQGIIYSSHIYPWKKDWAGKVLPAAEKFPLMLGEVGCSLAPMSFIPPEQHEDPYTWAPDMLGLIQKHRLNWTAWCFHPSASPMVISDWKYTPTPYWGVFVKEALGGKAFEMKRMR
jgi:hypothetical protein